MKTILKIGDKAKGFKFEDETDGNFWSIGKDKYIGKIGVITCINETYFSIDFNDGCGNWHYPISLMHLSVVEEQPEAIEIDMSKVYKVQRLNLFNNEFVNIDLNHEGILRFTMKDESKLKIEKEIEELEERIIELKKQL